MTALLSLRGVTRTVVLPNGAELPILKGVDLEVHAGEKVAIVGQSGTGKSTLLNIIGMLDLPDSGEYLFDGESVAQLGETRRSLLRGDSFGFIFQQFNLFMTRTALNNVEVPLLYSSDSRVLQRRNLAAQMLERVGLGDRLDSMPGEFSGGEQQRVAIARALARRPKVILADEPTGALDLNTGTLVMDLLEEVATEQNAALITITHDMSVAARAQSVYEIIDGRLHPVTAESALQRLSAERHLESTRSSNPAVEDSEVVTAADVASSETTETTLEVNDV